MAAQKGRSFLLKVSDNASPPSFVTLAGLRETDFSINGDTVDITDKDSNGFRELLDGGGTKSLSVSGSGVFDDDAQADELRRRADGGDLAEYQLTFGNSDVLTLTGQVTSFSRAGAHDGEETFDVTIESSGQWAYTEA